MSEVVVPLPKLDRLDDLLNANRQNWSVEWINRGTGQKLQRSTIEQLVRTRRQARQVSASLKKLHEVAGLRVTVRSEEERRLILDRICDKR